ncbi:MAG: CpaF family protein, partial [Lachnospiraceae bacterium]|nr:CpaF family protein [Lachnospiraceae bacterium]
QKLKKMVMSELDLSVEATDEDIGRIIDRCILEQDKQGYLPLKEKVLLRTELFNSFRRLDVLTEYIEDESITEIMVNGYDQIYLEKNGRVKKAPKCFESEEKLKSVVQQIVADCNRRINEASPIVDARLKDGSRVNMVLNPVALNGPVITIRKFPSETMTLKKLVELGALDEAASDFLKLLVKAKYNIFISGGTGSGKTTFLNALSAYIPKDERIITIEDAAELQIREVPNLIRLEARNANVEGENEITIRDLIKTSLRMRPDRIIVGEVRDAAAIDMLQAMNTGHDGSLSTGHANSSRDMLSRLETMVLMGMDLPLEAVRLQIASAVDIIIHLGRMRDKSRKVIEISEVLRVKMGEIEINKLYEFVETGESKKRLKGSLRRVNDLINVDKLVSAGLYDIYKERGDGLQDV